MEKPKINKISGKEIKWIEEWSLKFTSVLDKDKKREIVEWLKQFCPFFLGLTFPNDIKIEISEEIDPKGRKILITDREIKGYNFRDLSENVTRQDFSKLGFDTDVLFKNLIKNDYLDKNGVIQAKFKEASDLTLDSVYDSKKQEISSILRQFQSKQEERTYIYIVKSGNAFSWINYVPYLDRMKVLEKSEKKSYIRDFESAWIKETVSVKKDISHKEIKKKGVTFEIFCKGDVIIPVIDLLSHVEFFDSFFSSGYGFPSYYHHLFPLSMPISIISGTPFEYKCTEPLVLIRIELGEIKKIFPSKDKFLNQLLGYMSFKFFIDRWKFLTQWTNDTDIKILCILSLYFSGVLPLQSWKVLNVYIDEKDGNIKIKEEERHIGGSSFEKPRIPVAEFEVGESELAFSMGLTRQSIRKHIKGKKSIFKSSSNLSSKLKEIIKCELEQKNNYKFSAIHPESYFTADEIRRLIFSSLSVKKI